MTIRRENTVGVILSGGAGSRMDGADKGLLNYQDRPLIDWVIRCMVEQTSDLVICANRNIEAYQSFGHKVIRDDDADYQGPLAGLVSVIRDVYDKPDVTALLVSSCDTPNLPENLFERLRQALQKDGQIAVVNDGLRKQNLHCLIHRDAWPSLLAFFQSGGRAVHQWQNKAGVIEVDFSDQASAFLNVNRRSQL